NGHPNWLTHLPDLSPPYPKARSFTGLGSVVMSTSSSIPPRVNTPSQSPFRTDGLLRQVHDFLLFYGEHRSNLLDASAINRMRPKRAKRPPPTLAVKPCIKLRVTTSPRPASRRLPASAPLAGCARGAWPYGGYRERDI